MRRRSLLAALLVPVAANAQTGRLTFAALYKGYGVRGLEFSDQALALTGRAVSIAGYMAPPLKAESRFFVLSGEPLALCPFCQSDAEWPVDIVVIYLRETAPLTAAGSRVLVSGKLETGSWTDPDSGFVSQVRVVDAEYRA